MTNVLLGCFLQYYVVNNNLRVLLASAEVKDQCKGAGSAFEHY